MISLFDGIAAWFHHKDAGLCPKFFKELYNGQPGEEELFRFAVLNAADKPQETRSNINIYYQEDFRFDVVARTSEDAQEGAGAIFDAFLDKEDRIEAAGFVGLLSLDHMRTNGPALVADTLDLWQATMEYRCRYVVPRRNPPVEDPA